MEFIAIRLKNIPPQPSLQREGVVLDGVYSYSLKNIPPRCSLQREGVVLDGVYRYPVEEHPSPALPSKGGGGFGWSI